MSNSFSHIDEAGQPGMVDVSAKKETVREARAQAIVYLGKDVATQLSLAGWQSKKGSIIQTATIAGTMGAKKTSDLIPLCHPLGLDSCKFEFETSEDQVIITCICRLEAKTGVEMEALVGASIAALTVYDMCKSISKEIVIKETKLISKLGGKSDFKS